MTSFRSKSRKSCDKLSVFGLTVITAHSELITVNMKQEMRKTEKIHFKHFSSSVQQPELLQSPVKTAHNQEKDPQTLHQIPQKYHSNCRRRRSVRTEYQQSKRAKPPRASCS